jgi:hypothetical protein
MGGRLSTSYRRGFGELTGMGEFACESQETFTCAHCNNVFLKDQNEDPPICHKEHLPICLGCAKRAVQDPNGCTPFEKRLDQYEKRDAHRRAFFRELGME